MEMTIRLLAPSWVMKFLASIAASLIFVIGILLAVQLVVAIFVSDPTFSAARNFWATFGTANFAKVICGLALMTLAITISTEHIISWFVTLPENPVLRHSLSYFAAFYTVIVLSTAGFLLADFPNIPLTHVIAFLVMTVSSLIAALVYGVIALSLIHI